jgi:hypothetical protein
MKEGDAAMLLRFDPFRDIDRLANEVLGAPRVPQPMPMDCYRHGDTCQQVATESQRQEAG